MDDIFISQVEEPFQNIGDEGVGPAFIHLAVLSESGFQVTIAAEFSDDVTVTVAGEYLEAFEDIGMVKALEYIDFGVEQFFELLALQGLQLDYFDCYDFVWVGGAVLVISWWAR